MSVLNVVLLWLLSLVLVFSGGTLIGYYKGKDEEKKACNAEALSERITELERSLKQELETDAIAVEVDRGLHRDLKEVRVELVESVQVIEASWVGPDCGLPERVRKELEAGRAAANAAVSRL